MILSPFIKVHFVIFRIILLTSFFFPAKNIFAQIHPGKDILAIHCGKLSTDSLFSGVEISPFQDSTQCFTITNCGDSLKRFFADLQSNDYEISTNLSPILKPDSSFTFCVTYRPQKLSVDEGKIEVTPGGIIRLFGRTPCSHIVVSPKEISYGYITVGSYGIDSILLTNEGDLPFISGRMFSNSFGFRTIQYSRDTIFPHQSKSVVVLYQPLWSKKDSATLFFLNDGECGDTTSLKLFGEGVCKNFSHDTVVATYTPVGEKSTFRDTISNLGKATGFLQDPIIKGPGSEAFKILAFQAVAVLSGSSAIIEIEFAPKVEKEYQATLSFSNTTSCRDSNNAILIGNGIPSGVKDQLQNGFSLDQNYPNPFSGETSFKFTTPKETEIHISLHDLSGKLMKALIRGRISEGEHTIHFNAKDLMSGTYILRLESGDVKLTREWVLIK
jgi:hypothetical protein